MDEYDIEYSDTYMQDIIDDCAFSTDDDLSSHHDDYIDTMFDISKHNKHNKHNNHSDTDNDNELQNNLDKLVKLTDKKIKKNKKNKKLTDKRKTLYHNSKEVTATGVLFYKFVKKSIQVLVMFTKGKYEDPGGKIDMIDDTIESAAAREVAEETNDVITEDMVLSLINDKTKRHYSKTSKYLIHIVKASDAIKKLKTDDFGTHEKKYNYKRTFKWLDIDELYSKININGRRIHYRIMDNNLKNKIKSVPKKRKNLFA